MSQILCPICGGTGRPGGIIDDRTFKMRCRECGGSGYVEDYDNADNNDNGDNDYYPDDDDDDDSD